VARYASVWTCALAAASGLAACSSPVNEACSGNAACGAPIMDIGPAIAPTCSTATPPTALGGAYADGTYVLTAETLYQSGTCAPGSPVSQTLRVASGCEQWAETSATNSDGGANSPTSGSTTYAVQGNQIVGCEIDTESFTATAMTLTFYYPCGGGDPNCVEAAVYTKQ
jgi:hypothetical protein